jgi:hypothetical protein
MKQSHNFINKKNNEIASSRQRRDDDFKVCQQPEAACFGPPLFFGQAGPNADFFNQFQNATNAQVEGQGLNFR